MRKFREWLQARNEGWFDGLFGQSDPMRGDPEFKKLVTLVGEQEAVRLWSQKDTPVGKYQYMKALSGQWTPPVQEVPAEKAGFRAASTGGQEMMGEKTPGRNR